jgi:hypothetical protein
MIAATREIVDIWQKTPATLTCERPLRLRYQQSATSYAELEYFTRLIMALDFKTQIS